MKSPRSEAEPPAAPRSRLRDPWVRFAALFGLLALGSEVLYYGFVLGSSGLDVYLEVLAAISAWILDLIGEEAELVGTSIWNGIFLVDIAPECDAIQLCSLLCSAIVAFPTTLVRKAAGIALGIVCIQMVNFARIVSLFYIGQHHEPYFHTAHVVVWPGALIAVTLTTWVLWARYVTADVRPPGS